MLSDWEKLGNLLKTSTRATGLPTAPPRPSTAVTDLTGLFRSDSLSLLAKQSFGEVVPG